MNLIFFDDANRNHLLPFTFTRPVAEIRTGILTIREKWLMYFKDASYAYLTQPYLQKKFPYKTNAHNLYINGAVCPNDTLAAEAASLKAGEALYEQDVLLAVHLQGEEQFDAEASFQRIQTKSATHIRVTRVWDIFSKNAQAIEEDYVRITAGRTSAVVDDTNTLINPGRIFIEPGASVSCSILNASTGPIYIGKDAEVMEGTIVRGPFALCEHAGTKMAAKIYGATTVGPYCKVGGEVNNSVLFAYSNKGHDGFLGNAVVGEWCNIGADTNNSNLKNNYQEVKIWSYADNRFVRTGLQFCGLMMGDHSKCGINTMFNTGTVVGVAANIFGAGFPRNFIPSFAWGGAQGFDTFQTNKVHEMAEAMCKRRGVEYTAADKEIMEHIYTETAPNRFWENAKA